MQQITPKELEPIKNKPNLFLLDVRTKKEFDFVNIGGKLISINDLKNRLHEIPKDKEIITICHHGIRSARATLFLLENGFSLVKNLAGGIDKYALEVDKNLKRY